METITVPHRFRRKPNRPDPSPRIVRRPEVVRYVDDSMDLLSLTPAMIRNLHAVCKTSRAMYSLQYVIEDQMGWPHEGDAPEPPCTLDHDAWDAYEADERISA